uniref:Uncharacterized protein n=1 Tax=Anguilla anguilla TaxID=7936 RepID=A0A0E9SKS0_ANGAN
MQIILGLSAYNVTIHTLHTLRVCILFISHAALA